MGLCKKNLNNKIEDNLFLLGSIALEDSFKDGVAECIEAFTKVGIKFWDLTADKLDTAKSIGFFSNLLTHEYLIF